MRIEHSGSYHGHEVRCVVTNHDGGWIVKQEEDRVVVLDVVRRTWNRVECDLMLFDACLTDDDPPAGDTSLSHDAGSVSVEGSDAVTSRSHPAELRP